MVPLEQQWSARGVFARRCNLIERINLCAYTSDISDLSAFGLDPDTVFVMAKEASSENMSLMAVHIPAGSDALPRPWQTE
jgi:hypothetical protein